MTTPVTMIVMILDDTRLTTRTSLSAMIAAIASPTQT